MTRRARIAVQALLGATLVSILGLATAPIASAVVCGQPAKPEGEPTLGELGLDPENSDELTISFGADTDADPLELSFKVSGCTLDRNADVTIEKSGDSGAVTLKPLAPRHEVLDVTGEIAPKQFDPGTSKVRLTLTSPSHQVKTETVTLTLQRKQPLPWPLFWSVFVALLGAYYAYEVARQAAIDAYDKAKANPSSPPAKPGFWTALFKRRKDTAPAQPVSKVKYGHPALWLVVAVGAAGAAGAAFGAGYVKNDTWGSDELDWVVLLVAVAAAAAGGAAGGLTKAVTANT